MPFKSATDLGIASPPSTLTAVMRQVDQALSLMANATSFMVGKEYLKDFGVGSAPRVLFVPEPSGKVTTPYEMGNACAMVHSCNVYIRGAESGNDIARFDNAYAISDIILDLIITAGTGRIEWGTLADDSPANVDGPGADVMFSFTFQRDVRHVSRRWALAPASDNTLPAEPIPPPGTFAADAAFVNTVTPPSED